MIYKLSSMIFYGLLYYFIDLLFALGIAADSLLWLFLPQKLEAESQTRPLKGGERPSEKQKKK